MSTSQKTPSRRRALSALAAIAAAVSTALIAPPRAAGADAEPLMIQIPKPKNWTRTSLRQSVMLPAPPERVYAALLDAKQFAAFTGQAAWVTPRPGYRFSMFGDRIIGRNIDLVPGSLIVQAWRPTNWAPGIYSLVRFELKPHGSGTIVTLDQDGFPRGEYDSLERGWSDHYWTPLRKYLSA